MLSLLWNISSTLSSSFSSSAMSAFIHNSIISFASSSHIVLAVCYSTIIWHVFVWAVSIWASMLHMSNKKTMHSLLVFWLWARSIRLYMSSGFHFWRSWKLNLDWSSLLFSWDRFFCYCSNLFWITSSFLLFCNKVFDLLSIPWRACFIMMQTACCFEIKNFSISFPMNFFENNNISEWIMSSIWSKRLLLYSESISFKHSELKIYYLAIEGRPCCAFHRLISAFSKLYFRIVLLGSTTHISAIFYFLTFGSLRRMRLEEAYITI